MEQKQKKKKRENTITFLFLSNTLVQNEFCGQKIISIKKLNFKTNFFFHHLELNFAVIKVDFQVG